MSWTVLGSFGAASTQERETRALYEQHARPLQGYVLQLLGGDVQRAEDVVQETLLRCWRHHRLIGDGQDLRPWLFRVARNLVIDDYRLRRARPKEVDGAAWLEDVLADNDDIDRVLSSLMLVKAFETLSPAHREVLYETYYTGRSTREAALVLGIPPGTVKSRLYHALRNLRLALGVTGSAGDRLPTATEQPPRSPSGRARGHRDLLGGSD